MNLLQAILEHGLSIRQVPKEVISKLSIKHFEEGDEVEIWMPTIKHFEKDGVKYAKKRMERFYETFPEGRKFAVRKSYPKFGGQWMCKQVGNINSSVPWNSKKDNLAPTLNESINLFLKTL